MEHIYVPEGTEHMKVPFICSVDPPYSGDGFFEYPSRYTAMKGWDQDAGIDVADEKYGTLSPQEIREFLQSWLYFGVLVEFFRVGDVEVDLEKFVDKENGIITTAELRRYIRRWERTLKDKRKAEIRDLKKELKENKEKDIRELEHQLEKLSVDEDKKQIEKIEKKIKSLKKTEKYPHDAAEYAGLKGDNEASINQPGFKRVERILTYLHTTIEKHLVGGKFKFDPSTSALFPVPWEIIASMECLGYTLRDHLLSAFVIEAYRPVNRNRWKTPKCLTDMMVGKGFCRMDIGRLADHIDLEAIYYTGVAMDAQKNTVRSRLSHDACTERRCKAGDLYVESYLFKHEAGCDQKCQFIGVHVEEVVSVIRGGKLPGVRLVEKDGGGRIEVCALDTKKDNYVALSHVWSDGMGNPDDNALPVCVLRDIQSRVNCLYDEPEPQKKSSSSKSAPESASEPGGENPPENSLEKVPHYGAFWMDTLCIPVQEYNVQWRKKTILQMSSIYHDANKVLVLDSWLCELPSDAPITEIALRTFLCEWNKRLWTLQEGCLTRVPYIQFQDKALPFWRVYDRAYSFGESKTKRGYSLNFPNMVVNSVTDNFDDSGIGRVLSTHDKPGNWPAYQTFKFRMPSAHHRHTTRRADETLCLATLMHMDVKKLLDIPGTGDELADRRMEWFFGEVEGFGKAIIFHECERMPQEGMRWAPRSLLEGRPWDMPEGIGHESFEEGNYSKEMKSLYCHYPGITGIRGSRLGLETSIILESKSKYNPHQPIRRYKLQLLPDDKGSCYRWDPLREHAIIVHAEKMGDLQPEIPVKALVGSFIVPRMGEMMVPMRAENVAEIELLTEIGTEGLKQVDCNESDKKLWIIK